MSRHKLKLSFHSRWKLCAYIEKFHTEKCYGISYGNLLGVMSMEGFIKVYIQPPRNLEKGRNTLQRPYYHHLGTVLLLFFPKLEKVLTVF